MGLAVFWSPDLSGAEVVLDGAEGHHASVVRRIAPGELLRVTNGSGDVVQGPVTAVGKSGVTVSVEQRWSEPAPQPRLVVVQAVPKGERAELAVEMLTEVGADLIVPWNADRSQFRASPDRVAKLLSKWRAWAFESSKQSRRSWFCQIADLASTTDVAALLLVATLPVVLHEEATTPLTTLPIPPAGDIVLVIGPEGGLTPDELATFAVAPARLGRTVLRTSTAGVSAASVLLARTRWR